MSRGGYTPVGESTIHRGFITWGAWPEGYDVYIEVRDVHSARDGHVWSGGYHKVVVTGPQPRPRSKAFIGEMAWAQAERYASDAVSKLQRQEGW
jgi:hypothetical protein